MIALILLTWRECVRRALLPVAGSLIVVTVVTSKLFLGFSFGAATLEETNLAISAVFAAGLLHCAFIGSSIIRGDAERGTLALLMSKPLGLEAYVTGRFLGLLLSSSAFAIIVALMTCGVLYLMSSGAGGGMHSHQPAPEADYAALFAACGRGLLPIPPLVAASTLFSAVVPGFAAPIAVILLFAAGSLSGGGVAGVLLPDFARFGLEAQANPPLPPLLAYASLFSCFFLLLAYIFLATRLPLRSEG